MNRSDCQAPNTRRIVPSAGKIVLGVTALMLAVGALADTRPNVILLMADDMGWAQTGYYGHPVMKTPNLDDMARSGLRMDRFYAGAPSCTPTRASVMTGRTNDRTGAFRVGHAINKQEKMLSTAFREAGYSTAHFGKWHLNQAARERHPLPADDPHGPGQLGFDYWLSTTSGFDRFSLEGGGFELSRNGTVERFQGDGSEVIVDEALKYITTQVAEKKSGVRRHLVFGAPRSVGSLRGGHRALPGGDRSNLGAYAWRDRRDRPVHRSPEAGTQGSWHRREYARLVYQRQRRHARHRLSVGLRCRGWIPT